MDADNNERYQTLRTRLDSGELADQKCWSFIKEMNSYSDERLNSIAIRDGYRTYTYRQMFRQWERYAEAFSAVNITGADKSRVMLVGAPQTETILAFYGLNMTGASVSVLFHFDLYDDDNVRNMIAKEGVTDLVVSEIFAFPKVMKRLLRDKEKLGLRNIIVLESPMGGEYAMPALEVLRKLNTSAFREFSGGLVMSDLLRDHEAEPIAYGNDSYTESTVIMHTTGTVSGIHKPVPLSDKAMNSFVICAAKMKETYKEFADIPEHMVSCLMLNMSWVYAMVDMLHTSLGLGMEVICLPFGALNPHYSEVIEKYGVSILFTSRTILDSWSKTMPDIDLSKLKVIFMGGSYVSPEFKEDFNSYLRSCGSTARIINGYGLSEVGGACILAGSDRNDDAIGYPLPGVKVKIFSEDEERFYDLSDGPRTGVLFIHSPSMSNGKIDDTVFFELENIGGDDYFNSNDLVRVNDDGSMTCIGRSNKYFVNNEGVRFDAGLIETAMTAQPGIVACGLTPEFHKTLHDNVPVLYAETKGGKAEELMVLRKALIQVFINDGMLADTNMPSQCVITDKIPLNSGGKVDGKKLASGSVKGRRFNVKPVRVNDKIADILLIPATEGELATMGAGVPEELKNDPYTILSEVFACIPDINKGKYDRIFRIPGLREMILRLMDFDLKNIPGSLYKLAPKLIKTALDEYPMNLFKGDNDMSKWMRTMTGFMPPFGRMMMPPMPFVPPMPDLSAWKWPGWNGCDDDLEEDWDNIKSGSDTIWGQMMDMQRTSMEASKEQWKIFFDHITKMQESFIDSLPDEVPGIPSFFMPVPPKDYLRKRKEVSEMANEHVMEQADSMFDYAIKRQEHAKETVSEGVKNIEDEVKKKKKDSDDRPAKGTESKPKKKKESGKKGESKPKKKKESAPKVPEAETEAAAAEIPDVKEEPAAPAPEADRAEGPTDVQ